MAKMYEVRYKADNIIVAHQHASEHLAKIDAKQISKSNGRALLGEIDAANNNLIRTCEYAGGVQGRWENRSAPVTPCKVLLTIEDTREAEFTGIEAKPKPEISEEEKAQKKAALARIRDAQRIKDIKPAPKTPIVIKENDKKQKLLAQGYEPALADFLCKSNVHIDSPNHAALLMLWKGDVTEKDFPTMKSKDLNTFMNKLRGLLLANETGKAIVTKSTPNGMIYRLVSFKLEIIEEVA